MGNTNQNGEDKLISTVWLGVNSEWIPMMKEKISRIDEEWANDVSKALENCQYKVQRCFQKKIKKIFNTNEKYTEEQLKEAEQIISQNAYLRISCSSRANSMEQQSLSTSSNSVGKINESYSLTISVKSEIKATEDNCDVKIQQYYLFITKIFQEINSNNHPFIYMIQSFHKYALNYFQDIQQFNYAVQKLKIRTFGTQTITFINYLITSLNEYLGELDLQEENNFIKDKSKYFSCFLHYVMNQTITISLLQIIKQLDKTLINNIKEKLPKLLGKKEIFEIPKKCLEDKCPFIEAIEKLQQIQFSDSPPLKENCLSKCAQQIREKLISKNSRTPSSYIILQVTNYVIVQAQNATLLSEIHFLELFYPNSPVIDRFLQSIEFIQNIQIS